jgi:hypothetical protein
MGSGKLFTDSLASTIEVYFNSERFERLQKVIAQKYNTTLKETAFLFLKDFFSHTYLNVFKTPEELIKLSEKTPILLPMSLGYANDTNLHAIYIILWEGHLSIANRYPIPSGICGMATYKITKFENLPKIVEMVCNSPGDFKLPDACQ